VLFLQGEEHIVEQDGRDALVAWRTARPDNALEAHPDLPAVLEQYLGPGAAESLVVRAGAFGRAVIDVVEPAVVAQEASREFPRLRSFDELGQLVEQIEFHPAERLAAGAAWGSGMLATRLDYAGAFELATQFFLLSHVGEGGQACPIVCTVGLRRAIEHHASAELRDRYLPGLTASDASMALRGSQFLTEVQGGSDVGGNVTRATPDPDVPGGWRISGEKWFCSVADADLFAVTARPEGAGPGTRGLGCFLVPRTVNGAPNGFRIRRLKDKLGTRCLASAEIDFDGAWAWPIGDVDDGFKIAVTELLNTSRWLNAVGSAGIMSRAFLEASGFARHRRAFGQAIASYPGVREQLAIIKTEAAAAAASTWALTALVGRVDEGAAAANEVKVHRFLVNANKYATSIAATDVVHRAIEVLGGNGTIEDFSVLPRLYRDAIVFESWEGTHNVLCSQVRRDCQRLDLLGAVDEWTRVMLDQVAIPLTSTTVRVRHALKEVLAGLEESLHESTWAEVHFRQHLTEAMRLVQAACLLREASHQGPHSKTGALAGLLVDRHFGAEEHDADTWTRWVDEVL
jgi:alkylation response protein AidB-like acyl-CoA dehydrogenase